MRNKRLYFLLSAMLLLVIFFACNKNEDSEEKLIEQRVLQLKNMNEYGAKPLFQSFSLACEALQNDIENFSQSITLENLTTIRNQWETVGKLFKKCELYNIGDVNDKLIRSRIHRWPINIELLEDSLASDGIISAEYISILGSHILGIGTIEYLLFQNDPEGTLASFQANPRRLDYLSETSKYLKVKADELESIWEGYSSEFVTATESRISGGQNQMTNALLAFLEETIKLRLGKALGENNGGTPDLTNLEAYISNASLDFIDSGFEEWKNYFSGNFPNSPDNYGFDDYLIALDQETLVSTINTAISDCDAAIDQLTDLNTDLINNTEKVEDLKAAFQALTVLIKTDMASVIGAIVTVNDTDGD